MPFKQYLNKYKYNKIRCNFQQFMLVILNVKIDKTKNFPLKFIQILASSQAIR